MNIHIIVRNQKVRGIFHSANSKCGVVLVSGAGGGLSGPMGMYNSLSKTLKQHNISSLQLDYRTPNQLKECVEDLMAAVDILKSQYGIERVGVVGWSFGGAVVITAGVLKSEIVAVATIASQTAGTDLVSNLSPKPLLLLHGTDDTCLSVACSNQLYQRAKEPKYLELFKHDDHALSQNSDLAAKKLLEFFKSIFGQEASQ